MSIPTKIMSDKKKMNETNDCSIIAVAITTRRSYAEVHKVFKRLGRKPRRGVHMHTIRSAFSILGFDLEKSEYKGKTAKTLRVPTKDMYVALTASHILAVQFGLVKDWTAERRHRINNVYRVVER